MAEVRTFEKPFAPLDDEKRRRSLEQTLAGNPDADGDLWLFVYGSLMWDPDFPHLEAAPARLMDWRRAMCVWTILARGTPDRPGLSLGLLPGGLCDGLAFRIAAAGAEERLAAVWQREMWTDIYHLRWTEVTIADESVPAITFVSNRSSVQFAGELPPEVAARYIATARGERGSCRDYLSQTLDKLGRLGIAEAELIALHAQVKDKNINGL